jgi:hypothetical protein
MLTHNTLQVNYFQFILERVPNMVYFCQTANLPGVAFGVTTQPTHLGYPVQVPTGAYRFENLELSFRVDENLANWLEIYRWMTDIGNYQDVEGTKKYVEKTSGARLLITNSSYKPKIAVEFAHVFPTYLSSLTFSTAQPQSVEMLAMVRFAFTTYTISGLTGA